MLSSSNQSSVNWADDWLGPVLNAYVPPEHPALGLRSAHAISSSLDSDFERSFQQYENRVTGYLWGMTGNIDEAHDLCQETFIRAWQQFQQVAAYDHQAAWLFRVATHLVLNQTRRPRASPLLDSQHPASSDPGRHIVERDMVRQVLFSLPGKQRAMLILRELYGYSYEEMGQMLGTSADAVRMGLSRARSQFRILYERKDH